MIDPTEQRALVTFHRTGLLTTPLLGAAGLEDRGVRRALQPIVQALDLGFGAHVLGPLLAALRETGSAVGRFGGVTLAAHTTTEGETLVVLTAGESRVEVLVDVAPSSVLHGLHGVHATTGRAVDLIRAAVAGADRIRPASLGEALAAAGPSSEAPEAPEVPLAAEQKPSLGERFRLMFGGLRARA